METVDLTKTSNMVYLSKEKRMDGCRIVILDFDGTLADTAAVIIRTMHATFSELGLPDRTDEQCAAMIGLRLIEIPPVLFPECSIDAELYAYLQSMSYPSDGGTCVRKKDLPA